MKASRPQDPDLERLVEAADAWISTAETQKKLQAALAAARALTAKLDEARAVTQDALHDPVTM